MLHHKNKPFDLLKEKKITKLEHQKIVYQTYSFCHSKQLFSFSFNIGYKLRSK